MGVSGGEAGARRQVVEGTGNRGQGAGGQAASLPHSLSPTTACPQTLDFPVTAVRGMNLK